MKRLLATIGLLLLAGPAIAEDSPYDWQQHPGESVPLSATFHDETGATVPPTRDAKGELPALSSKEKLYLAMLCQAAENQFVGVQSGLLDQISSLFGKAWHAMSAALRPGWEPARSWDERASWAGSETRWSFHRATIAATYRVPPTAKSLSAVLHPCR